MKAKLSRYAAENLVKAWRADACLGQLGDDVRAELVKRVGFIPYEVRVQVILGKTPLTSDLLWAGNFAAAIDRLQRDGIALGGSNVGAVGVKVGNKLAQRRADNRRRARGQTNPNFPPAKERSE